MAVNILIVDDSAVMRSMILKTIRNSGVELGEVHEAGDGREGLEQLNQNWVDLIFIDVNMPVMNGMEMLQEVRSNPETRSCPVLIVSTESNHERIERINALGAGFVHKPFTPEKLKSSILNALGVAA